jgi:hypothetical protein
MTPSLGWMASRFGGFEIVTWELKRLVIVYTTEF